MVQQAENYWNLPLSTMLSILMTLRGKRREPWSTEIYAKGFWDWVVVETRLLQASFPSYFPVRIGTIRRFVSGASSPYKRSLINGLPTVNIRVSLSLSVPCRTAHIGAALGRPLKAVHPRSPSPSCLWGIEPFSRPHSLVPQALYQLFGRRLRRARTSLRRATQRRWECLPI